MRALGHDQAAVEHDDSVCVDDGGQPMRDDHCRAPLHQAFQRKLHHSLAFCVERACRFIQQQDRPPGEHCARDCQTLPGFGHLKA